jgi:hypothetical protein
LTKHGDAFTPHGVRWQIASATGIALDNQTYYTIPMNALIVEKEVIDLRRNPQPRQTHFAVATSARIPESVCFSLTYEAHLTQWQPDRAIAQTLCDRLTTTA